MESYNVKEIADLLGASQETVRRWIRNKELKASVSPSRKEGSVVSQDQLAEFLQNNSKYAAIAAQSVKTSPVVGAVLLVASVAGPAVGSLLKSSAKKKALLADEIEISLSDTRDFIKSKEASLEEEIEKLKVEINQARRDAAEKEKQLDALKKAWNLIEGMDLNEKEVSKDANQVKAGEGQKHD